MPFARRRRVDLYLSAAAACRLISVSGGGVRFSAARRRRRGVLRLLTQFHTFYSVNFYSFTIISLPFTYYLTGKHRYNLWVVKGVRSPPLFKLHIYTINRQHSGYFKS
jgi:hypothetical protein